MTRPRPCTRRWIARLLGGLASPVLLPILAGAAEPAPAAPAPAAATATVEGTAPASVPVLGLAECVQLALERQPALAASRASLAAALAQNRGLNDLKAPPILAGRELPTRRKQAAAGIVIAEAGVLQAEWETIYAAKRMYYAVLYANEQNKLAKEVVENLRFYLTRVKEQVEKGESREWSTSTVDKIAIYVGLAETRQAEAARGMERAAAALREAMGVGPDFCFHLRDEGLPNHSVEVCRDAIVQLALGRRGELVQVTHALDVFNLEVDAQAASCMPVTRTFAAGSDLHARPIPQGVMNGEYRPGAVGLEMPPNMAGTRSARIERAKHFAARASAVVDKTRGLIALEAEDVYLRWLESSRKAAQTREAAGSAARLATSTRKDFLSSTNVKMEDILMNEVLASQAQSSYNEARFQLAIALAALERVTAGGFCATASPAQP